MDERKFIFFLLLGFINFVLLLVGNAFIPVLYIYELTFIIVSLIMGIMLIINLYRGKFVYGSLTFFHIINLVNFLILYIFDKSLLFGFGVASNLIGAVFAVYFFGHKRDELGEDELAFREERLYDKVVPEVYDAYDAESPIKISKVVAQRVSGVKKKITNATKKNVAKNLAKKKIPRKTARKKAVKTRVTKKPVKRSVVSGKIVSSARSNLYHRLNCQYVAKIPANKRIYFNSTASARRAGKKAHRCK